MNSKVSLIFCLFFFCMALALPARASREKGDVVRASGVVRLVGGGPMPELVITGTDREWYIPREEEHKLTDLQQRIVTVEGEETVEELRFASGISAGERRILKNIKVIEVE